MIEKAVTARIAVIAPTTITTLTKYLISSLLLESNKIMIGSNTKKGKKQHNHESDDRNGIKKFWNLSISIFIPKRHI